MSHRRRFSFQSSEERRVDLFLVRLTNRGFEPLTEKEGERVLKVGKYRKFYDENRSNFCVEWWEKYEDDES